MTKKISSLKISLLLNNLVIFSDITNNNNIQSNYYNKIFVKKGYHKLYIDGFTEGLWCSNPESNKGFEHGRYIAIYYKNKNKNKNIVNKTNLSGKSYYSVPNIISYIK